MQSQGQKDTGYLHAGYARSLKEFGDPIALPYSGGWILRRKIPGTAHYDAMGCYPLFVCRDWSRLGDDLRAIQDDTVSLVLVTDPFGDYGMELLRDNFDRVIPFKTHYIADLRLSIDSIVRKSHKAAIRRALKHVDVRVAQKPWEHCDLWVELFEQLAKRHKISGIRAFSASAFEAHLRTPGMIMFEARVGNEIVGLDLWYVMDDIAYGHLVAFNELGYRRRASYATKWTMLNYFADKVRWVDLGGAAGLDENANDGLARFKSGWSTDTRTAYLCCRVLQPKVYDRLCAEFQISETNYVPAYRAGEFQ